MQALTDMEIADAVNRGKEQAILKLVSVGIINPTQEDFQFKYEVVKTEEAESNDSPENQSEPTCTNNKSGNSSNEDDLQVMRDYFGTQLEEISENDSK